MSHDNERRATAAQRIPLETLVEICSNGTGDRPFEAESVDVSGRGMRMRTAYLPGLGAPLACRFSDRGRAVVVEGVVAWRDEHARGGEFGVKFTALDASGAEVLQQLCGVGSTAAAAAVTDADQEPLAAGTRVRLHLDGLGEPMKARVRDAGSRKVQVASNLAFLRLGRRMNVEDVDHSARRAGSIESVGVVVEPQSGVPQLVVSLRFDESEDTPEPAVVDLAPSRDRASVQRPGAPAPAPLPSADPVESRSTGKPLHASASRQAKGAQPASELPLIESSAGAKAWGQRDAPEAELADEASRLRSRFETQAAKVSAGAAAAARYATSWLTRCSVGAARHSAGLLRGAGRIATQWRHRTPAKPLRRTAPAPRGPLSVEGRRLRPQGAASAQPGRARAPASDPARTSGRTRKLVLGIGVSSAVIVGAVALWAGRGGPATTAKHPAAGPMPALSAAPRPAPTALAASSASGVPKTKQGIVAEVPLFGRTPMATMEPVPVPSTETPPGATPPVAAPADEEAQERAAAEASANETWEEQEAQVRPEDVKPWGRGRLNLPTIHRVKLDRPGADLRGAAQATGFSVLVPHRRVAEAVAGIAKRDRRITSVRADNSDAGARITFRFRAKAPPYRVRLRGQYVEFFISAAE
ncbi:MAG: PilZ domain-containing protein [Polyangiaceae bacterium]|nr:PilZ domain-containing protein [Polyangiaceae bacterium]